MVEFIFQCIIIFVVSGIATAFLVTWIAGKLNKKEDGWVMAISIVVALVATSGYVWSRDALCHVYASEHQAQAGKFSIWRGTCLIQDPNNGKWVTLTNYGRAN